MCASDEELNGYETAISTHRRC